MKPNCSRGDAPYLSAEERRACEQASAFISAFVWLLVATVAGCAVYFAWPWFAPLIEGGAR